MEVTAPIAIVSLVCGAVVGLAMLSRRSKQQTESTQLLEKALSNPAVDRATLETLTYQMTGRRPLRTNPNRRGLMAWVLLFGWIAMFVGVALLVGGVISSARELELAGWIVGLISLGFVTYPFALRELESRRAT